MIFATRITKKLFSVVLVALLFIHHGSSVSAVDKSGGVVIYQVQTGDAGSTAREYVSLFNNSDSAVEITNWCLVYVTASNTTQTALTCIKTSPDTRVYVQSRTSVTFATSDFAGVHSGYALDYIFNATLSGTSGHVKLLGADKKVIDTVGWGSATNAEGNPVLSHANGKILQRKNLTENSLQDTNNNFNDFSTADPLFATGGNTYEEIVAPGRTVPIELSEVLANPEGADSGKEFIEFHNPTEEAVSLKNYVLQMSPSYNKNYPLPDKIIEPGGYIAVGDTETKLTLPNTSAGLKLSSISGVLVDESHTYHEPEEGSSWALVDDIWATTYRPTPGQPNELLATKACALGEQYVAESNKCLKAPVTVMPMACKVNQTRNPDTGRCRNIVTAAAIAPCKAGQVRNPGTGRCRNAASAQSIKECLAGQTRSPDTGRCRKDLPPISKASVTDIETPLITNNLKWWITGAGLLAAGGYALFEWRKEALGFALNLRNKFATSA